MPRPGALDSSSFPPSNSARSRIPDRPKPVGAPSPDPPAPDPAQIRQPDPPARRSGRHDIEPHAVVGDLKQHPVALSVEPEPDRPGIGVLGHVLQGFLRRPVDGGLHMLGHRGAGGLDPHIQPGKGVAKTLQARGQAKVVQDRRAQARDG